MYIPADEVEKHHSPLKFPVTNDRLLICYGSTPAPTSYAGRRIRHLLDRTRATRDVQRR